MTPLIVAKPTDAPLCTRLFFDVFSNPPWEYPWITIENVRRYMDDMLSLPGALSFLYYENETLTGLCIGGVNDYFLEPQYEIKEFAISQTRQRKGAGTRMLAEVENYLAKSGINTIFLHTSRSIPAYDFYKKNGYTTIEDNVYFVKQL